MTAGDTLVEAIADAVALKLEKMAGCNQRLLDIDQAAEYLGMSPVALRHECQCGNLHIVRIDSVLRFDIRELDRYLTRNPNEDRYKSDDEKAYQLAISALNRKPRGRQRVVYFVACGDAVKIGVSQNGPARIKMLQSGNPVALRLLGMIPGDGETELALHHAFSGFRVLNEWFRFEGAVKRFIQEKTGKVIS